jgi:hypothetical protein
MPSLLRGIPYPDLQPGTHLLLDEHVVADAFRLRRVLHKPRPEAPISFQARSTPAGDWEAYGDYVTRVAPDPAGGFRMWYYLYNFENERLQWEKHRKQLGEPQRIYLCYARSEDGLHWTRPDLGIYEDDGGRNNITFKGHTQCSGPTLALPGEHPLGEQYFLFNNDWLSREHGGLCIAHSEDGVRWRYRDDQPVIFGHYDTTNSALYNPDRKVWMYYTRTFHSAAYGWVNRERNTRRRVTYSQSADLDVWSEPQTILRPDELDTNDFYSLNVFRCGGYYLGQLQVYDEEGRESIHIELAWSRDGVRWSRLPTRTHFIVADETTGLMIVPAQAPFLQGDELWVYYTAFPTPHNAKDEERRPGPIWRARLRRDGFISLQAGRPLGALITRPFTLQSDAIFINARAWSGEIRAELVEVWSERKEGDFGGRKIKGFTAADFQTFRGDSTRHELRWKGDLSTLRGKRLLLKLALSCAEIWSVTI